MQKIRSITTFMVSDETSEEGYKFMYEERDEAGLLLLQEQFFPNGTLEQRIEKEYDGEARLLVERHFSEDDEPHQTYEYDFDESGKVKQVRIIYLDGSISYKNYQRNEAENSTTIQIVDDEEEEEGKEFRRYDSEGKVLEESIFEEGDLVQKIVNQYNEDGRPAQQAITTAEGEELLRNYEYDINDKGLINELLIKDDKDDLVRRDTISYDDKGNKVEHRIEDLEQGYAVITKWEYDEKERLVLQQSMQPDGKLLEETAYRYNEGDDLLKEQEKRTRTGVSLNYYEYQFH